MNWNLAGKALSLYIEFKQDDEFVIPDAGSIKLTLRGNDGTVLTGYDAKALPDSLLSTTIVVVPDTLNAITAATFETRFVRVDFTVGTKPLYQEQVYQLAPFLPMTATAEDVRGLFGARVAELPDSEVDLRGAYYTLLEDYPLAMAGTLTQSTTALLANTAIVFKAGLMLGASMPGRMLRQESLNNATNLRGTIDWVALQEQNASDLGVVIGKLEKMASVAGSGLPTPILVLSSPTDPITNA